MSKLSIVIPVYYNSDTLMMLYEDMKEKILGKIGDYEIVFVDDGSGDNSWVMPDGDPVASITISKLSFVDCFVVVTVGILLNSFSLLSCFPITVTFLFIEWNACAIQYASLPSPKIAMLVFSLISIWVSISNAAAKGSV